MTGSGGGMKGVAGTVGDAGGVKDPTSARLLKTAAELFWKNGFASTSTRELSERLGIQKASLYHHIRSKEDLLYEISTRSLDHIHQAALSALTDASSDRKLPAVIHAHLQTALAEREMHATMLTELRSMSSARRADVLSRRDGYEQLIREVIRSEQRAGRIRADMEPALLTLALLNLLNWTIFWYRPDGALTAEELATQLCEIFMHGATST